ncbi:MAG: gamma-glutamylcyclotransferase family protein [Chryseolinea sp.]
MSHLKYYAYYGSLRRGMDNYSQYADHLTYIDTVQLNGFSMFSLGEYPYAIMDDGDHSIVAELFEVTNAVTEQMICTMEMDAHYILSTVQVENTIFGIFLFEKVAQTDRPVVHGDWCKYWKERAF